MKPSSNGTRFEARKTPPEMPLTKIPTTPAESSRTISTWHTDTSASESGGLPTHPRRAQRLHMEQKQPPPPQYHPSQLYHPQREGEEDEVKKRSGIDSEILGGKFSSERSSVATPEKRRIRSRSNADRYSVERSGGLDSSSDCLEFTPNVRRSPAKMRSSSAETKRSDFSRHSDGGRSSSRSRSRPRARRRERGTSLEPRRNNNNNNIINNNSSGNIHAHSQDEGMRLDRKKARSRGTSLEPRKTKMDKIYELLDENKALKGDNGSLRREILDLEKRLRAMEKDLNSAENALKQEQEYSRSLKENQLVVSTQPDQQYRDGETDNEEKDKMRHAMQALSKLSQAQGDQLRKLQVRFEDRAAEIEEKVERIEYLEGNEEKLETQLDAAYREMKLSKKEVSMLQQELVDKEDQIIALEEQRDKAKAGTRIIVAQHEESIARADRLEEELDALRRERRNGPETADSANVEQLKKELARKIEHIVLLEFDLEVQKEELRAVKDKKMMDETFPVKRGFVDGFGNDDSSFAEDATWGSFTNDRSKPSS